MSAQGEDRSGFQAEDSWRGNSFGFCKATEGLSFVDPTFAANWDRLRAEGKVRGSYHFFHPAVDPLAQARFFVATVKKAGLRPGDMLVADIEILSGAQGVLQLADEHAAARSHVPVTGTMGATSIGTEARRFLDEVEALAGVHVHPVLTYTNLAVAASLAPCASRPLWIALPGTVAPADVSPWKTWQFWQWSFGGGRGGGDRDAFNGSRADMHKWLAGYRKPRRKPHLVTRWAADGKATLAALAAQHKTLPSTILRLTAEHGASREFDVPVSVWLNSVFGGVAPATDPVPEGTVLVVPAA